jgi:rhodanese-related sulfurtransferase
MRHFCWGCAVASALALSLACGFQPTTGQTIGSDELARLLEQPGKVFFLDVREPAEIARKGSVKGYVNIPLSQLERRLGEVPRNKLIVTL